MILMENYLSDSVPRKYSFSIYSRWR